MVSSGLSGVEEPADVGGRVTGLWPMIKPDGHSAGAKLHPSGSWCKDIRTGYLCFCLIKTWIVHEKYVKHRICHPFIVPAKCFVARVHKNDKS